MTETNSIRRRFKRWLVLAIGWGFVLLGIAGLVLPILQGILFLLIGLAILSRESPWAQRLLDRLRNRYPSFAQKTDEATARAKRLWLRFTGNNNGAMPGSDPNRDNREG